MALIDFDFAAPGRLIFDLAAFARMCVPLNDDINAQLVGWAANDRPARLRVFADAYGFHAHASSLQTQLVDGCCDFGRARCL